MTSPLWGTPSLAILGDRYTTGTAAGSQFQLDFVTVWQQIEAPPSRRISSEDEALLQTRGLTSPFPMPTRLPFSSKEFTTGMDWSIKHLLAGLTHLYYNREELSWGALLGKRMGIPASQIFLAGHPGEGVAMFPSQVNRLLQATGGKIPENVMVWFAIEELCQPNMELGSPGTHYSQALEKGLQILAAQGTPAPTGSHIWILSPLKATELFLTPEIQNKSVYAFGKTTTCQKLEEEGFHTGPLPTPPQTPALAGYLADFIPPNPARICPGLFAHKKLPPPDPREKVATSLSEKAQKARKTRELADEVTGKLSQQIRESRQKSREMVEATQAVWRKKAPNLSVIWVSEMDALHLEAPDMAQNCFDLSVAGHVKVEDLVYRQLHKEGRSEGGNALQEL